MAQTFQFAGTVSSGTLRFQDLLPSCLDALKGLDRAAYIDFQCDWPTEMKAISQDADIEPEQSSEMLDDLFNRLNESAPEGFYFGSHEGDGADFGFWPHD